MDNILSQKDVDEWYADGPSDDKDVRLMDTIFICSKVGACSACGWKRVKAEFEYWETINGPNIFEYLASKDDITPMAPHTSCQLLCNECVLEHRAWADDPEIKQTLIRRITRLTEPLLDSYE